ncbi:MAG: toxin-antitoxin system YwqK family antitoxin [Candidatus Methylacidiphilales bacterium]|nr:hypothetical protein [Candidatus Methylacidiphilales bacterium]
MFYLVSNMQYVDADDLEPGENGGYYYSGKPFTGIARDLLENGMVIFEMTISDGKLNGPSTSWYANGNLEWQKMFRCGYPEGSWSEYYEDGKLKIEATLELGFVLESTEWHPDGNISTYKMSKQDPEFKSLELMRAIKWKCGWRPD